MKHIIIILLFGTLNMNAQKLALQIANTELSSNINYNTSNSEFGLDIGFIEKENCPQTCTENSHLKFFYRNYFEGSFLTEGNFRTGFTGIFSNLYENKVKGGIFLGYNFNKFKTKLVWNTADFKIFIKYEF